MFEVFDVPIVVVPHVVPFFSYTFGTPPGEATARELIDPCTIHFNEKIIAIDNWHISIVRFSGFTLNFLGNPIIELNPETPNFPVHEAPFIAATVLAMRKQVSDWISTIGQQYLREHGQARLLPLDGSPPEPPDQEMQKRAWDMMAEATQSSGRHKINVQNQQPPTPPAQPAPAKAAATPPATDASPLPLPLGAQNAGKPKPLKGSPGPGPRIRAQVDDPQ